MNYLFLYTELAGYTIACLRALKDAEQGSVIRVIHFPINPEAPFQFDFSGIGEFRELSFFSTKEQMLKWIDEVPPDKIICSGWVNKGYLRVCERYRKQAVCVLTLDNHWEGTIKQQIMRSVGRFVITRLFKKAWVPGRPQQQYAMRLGFREQDIHTGFYSCDTVAFHARGKKQLPEKCAKFPKVILCVARYIPAKGYDELWTAFLDWQNEAENDWELWCAGTGDGFEHRVKHPKIKHLGFVQETEWEQITRNSGVFVLFSRFEPWGVVVHEFASAGYPMILSDKVGAAEAFLDGENGWLVESGNTRQLLDAFRQLNTLSEETLCQMAMHSHELGNRLSVQTWAATLRNM